MVDDDPLVAQAVAASLEGHEVCIASGGGEAIARCAGQAYDCILCDVMMPDISGIDVYTSLVSQGRGLERHLVFMTGGAVTEGAKTALSRAGRPVLEKPVDVLSLRAAVAKVMRAARDESPAC